jgi:hypothetical protein
VRGLQVNQQAGDQNKTQHKHPAQQVKQQQPAQQPQTHPPTFSPPHQQKHLTTQLLSPLQLDQMDVHGIVGNGPVLEESKENNPVNNMADSNIVQHSPGPETVWKKESLGETPPHMKVHTLSEAREAALARGTKAALFHNTLPKARRQPLREWC